MSILPEVGALVGAGTGMDLVSVASFADQLAAPGTTFAKVFTDREWAYCQGRGEGGRIAESLAARWAAKEAMVKAWSSLISPDAPPIGKDRLDWAEIEVVRDQYSRPGLRFHGEVARALAAHESELGARLDWTASLSHDGGFAIALVHVLAITTDSRTSADTMK